MTVRLGAGVAILLVLGSTFVCFRAWRAHEHLNAAQSLLQRAREQLLEANPDAATRSIREAGQATRSARSLTGDPVWSILQSIPVAGDSLQTARGSIRAVDDVASQVLPDALASTRLLEPRKIRRPDGRIDLEQLSRAAPYVDRSVARVATAEAAVRALPRRHLVPVVSRGHARVQAQLIALRDTLAATRSALRITGPLLGEDRPRRLFVLVQQTSESRGTGGLPGGFAIVETDRGRIRVTEQGSNSRLQGPPIAPPSGTPDDVITRYTSLGMFALWSNVNVSPDLPVVARVVAARWKAEHGQHIDGVVALDALALSLLLRGGGPVPVPGGSVAPESLPEYLAVGQYRAFDPASVGVDQANRRKDEIASVTRLAAERVAQGAGSSTELVRGIVDAVRSGHLRIASDDPLLAAELRALSIDGGLPTGRAPVAYPVLFNSTGAKLDYFLDRSVLYAGGPCTGARRATKIVVALTNRAPARGLPGVPAAPCRHGRACVALGRHRQHAGRLWHAWCSHSIRHP